MVGVGVPMLKNIRVRSTGLVQSQAMKTLITKITLRNCSVLNGIEISGDDITSLPLKRSTVVCVKDLSQSRRLILILKVMRGKQSYTCSHLEIRTNEMTSLVGAHQNKRI